MVTGYLFRDKRNCESLRAQLVRQIESHRANVITIPLLKNGKGSQALDRLVPLSSKDYSSYTRGLSTN
jgi:hypothetical protein